MRVRGARPPRMKRSCTEVPCMCQLCNGCLVSGHVRTKHTAACVSSATSPQLTPFPLCNQDVENMEGVREDLTDVRGDEECVACVDDFGGTPVGLENGRVVMDEENVENMEVLALQQWCSNSLHYECTSINVLHTLVKDFHWFSEHPKNKQRIPFFSAFHGAIFPSSLV